MGSAPSCLKAIPSEFPTVFVRRTLSSCPHTHASRGASLYTQLSGCSVANADASVIDVFAEVRHPLYVTHTETLGRIGVRPVSNRILSRTAQIPNE